MHSPLEIEHASVNRTKPRARAGRTREDDGLGDEHRRRRIDGELALCRHAGRALGLCCCHAYCARKDLVRRCGVGQGGEARRGEAMSEVWTEAWRDEDEGG